MNDIMRLLEYIKLLRVHQWYKNAVIFLALLFVGELFSLGLFEKTFIGFFGLCFISSANYILNDIIDVKKDRLHPEKKSRPLASGSVKIFEAIILLIVMLFLGIYIGYSISISFLACLLFLFLFTIVYSLLLKNEFIADVVSIAINFVVRAIAGTFIIGVFISPWLVLCPFFLALFLAVGKRKADLKFMKTKAYGHKEVLKYYTPEITNALMLISTACLILAYSLYAISRTPLLLITLPFAIYIVFRYYYLVNNGSEIGRHPELIYKDWRIMIGLAMLIAIILLIFYVIQPYASSFLLL